MHEILQLIHLRILKLMSKIRKYVFHRFFQITSNQSGRSFLLFPYKIWKVKMALLTTWGIMLYNTHYCYVIDKCVFYKIE